MSDQKTTPAFSFDDLQEERSLIVPNIEKKGNKVKCASIEIKMLGKEDEKRPACVFGFVDSEGAILDYALFEPVLEDATDKEELRLYTNNMNRIKHMFNAYAPTKEGINTKGVKWNGFEDMINWFKGQIVPDFDKVDTVVKAVYNKRGIVTLGTIGNVISTPNHKRTFDWNDKYDFVNRPTKKADSFAGGDDDDDL